MVLQPNAKAAFWDVFYEEPRWHFTFPASNGFAGASTLQTNTAVGVSGTGAIRCLIKGPTPPSTYN